MSGLSDTAVMINAWLSLSAPALIPVRSIIFGAASSMCVSGSGMLSKVGASLTAFTTTSNIRITVSVPPLPSDTVTVMVAIPLLSGTGV